MNQKIINIILGAGIAVLLFLQLKNVGNASATSPAVKADTAKALKLAYVDLDSIQEKYIFYKEKMLEFEKKKESADRDLNNAFQKIENEKNTFAKRGQSITQAEYENFQRAYQTKMQNLDQQKQLLENSIASEGAKTMEELKKRINDFLVEYNKKQAYSYIFSYSAALNILFYKDPSQDITNEVVAGLNAAYKKSNDKN